MVTLRPNRPARGSASSVSVGPPHLRNLLRIDRGCGLSWARGTRKVEGCAGRRSRPAQRAEAKRTPEQPGRGRRDDPLKVQTR
jgi:hypothetical protein